MQLSDGYSDCFPTLEVLTIKRQNGATRATNTFEILGRETSVRKQHVRTDETEDRVIIVKITILEFWPSLQCLGIPNVFF